MDQKKRIRGAEAYLLALRTGEVPATAEAGKYLAKDVQLFGAPVWGRQGASIDGYDDVLYRVTGEWPNTPVYVKGHWSAAKADGDQVKVSCAFPGMGAAPSAMNIAFSYNADDLISRIDQEIIPQPRPEASNVIADNARGTINGALRNNTPMTVAYVDANGVPHLSLRGSVQVWSDTQLCAWLRDGGGGMPTALKTNPNIAMLYRDSNTRSTLVITGKGRIDDDPEVRDRIWNMIQDVEQKHETRDRGVALIVDVTSIGGGTARGGVRFQAS